MARRLQRRATEELAPVLKQGLLQKLGENEKGWKERHFVLTSEGLAYHKKKGGKAAGTISVKGHSIGTVEEKEGNKFVFWVQNNKRRYWVCAPDEFQQMEWLEALLSNGATGTVKDLGDFSYLLLNEAHLGGGGELSVVLDDPTMDGYLEVTGAGFGEEQEGSGGPPAFDWRRYHCVLQGGIVYCAQDRDSKPIGSFSVKGIVLKIEEFQGREHPMCFYHSETQRVVCWCNAPDIASWGLWVTAITPWSKGFCAIREIGMMDMDGAFEEHQQSVRTLAQLEWVNDVLSRRGSHITTALEAKSGVCLVEVMEELCGTTIKHDKSPKASEANVSLVLQMLRDDGVGDDVSAEAVLAGELEHIEHLFDLIRTGYETTANKRCQTYRQSVRFT